MYSAALFPRPRLRRQRKRLGGLGLPVQEAEVGLPADGDDAGEQGAVLEREVGEADGRDRGPDLARVDDADGHGGAHAVPRLRQRVARQQRLPAEEVRVEDGREDGLVDGDLDGDGQDLGRVVEVLRQEDEPT